MNRRLYEVADNTLPEGQKRLVFHCPGCDESHCVISGRWAWNGSLELPTFSPSVLTGLVPDFKEERCHSFIENGQIKFLADCWHKLKNKTVDLPSVEHMWK